MCIFIFVSFSVFFSIYIFRFISCPPYLPNYLYSMPDATAIRHPVYWSSFEFPVNIAFSLLFILQPRKKQVKFKSIDIFYTNQENGNINSNCSLCKKYINNKDLISKTKSIWFFYGFLCSALFCQSTLLAGNGPREKYFCCKHDTDKKQLYTETQIEKDALTRVFASVTHLVHLIHGC